MFTSERALHWSGCRNVRDLGGLPVSGGGSIRPGALIRADSLDRLDPDGLLAFAEHHTSNEVSLILDLRGPGEVDLRPHPFGEDPRYRLVPMIDPRREPARDRSAERTLGMIYSSSLDRNARCIVDGVAAIADAPPGGVVVHCAVGKDRTGMIVALVLSALGVPDDEIAQDYELSAECLREEFDEVMATLDGEQRVRIAERMSSRRETILELLEHARAHYGGAEGYLLAHGLGSDRLRRLKDRLVSES
jgi:protein-tyrosine phosphatase